MLRITILCIGKVKESFFREAINEYDKRLSKYCKLKIKELPDEKIPDKFNSSVAENIKQRESNLVKQSIPKDSFVFCLDLTGKEYSSEEFSAKLSTLSIETSHITFIIGGSLGMSNDLLHLANQKICFSKMTFPHQLIRIFLLEQIFRAFKIAHGETYHR